MTYVESRVAVAEPGFLELFGRKVALDPDAPAVICDGAETSFGDLDLEANRLANHLRSLGVGPETVVGILLDRAPRLAVAVLGVLKAGGAFLTLDAAYPPDRVAFMLGDAAVPVLLTTAELASKAQGASPAHTMLLDDEGALAGAGDHDPGLLPAPTSAAYVVYTSGSTGQPKGAVIEHRSLVRFARETAQRLQLGAGDRFLQFASPGFDVLVEELFPVWSAGGAVVFPPPAMIGPGIDVTALVERERLTVMELPAAFWHEWVREVDGVGEPLPDSLRLVIVGAERVLPERLAMWQKLDVPLMHVYGITETTVSSTFFRLAPNAPDADLRHLPIGTALPFADLRILDPELKPVPQGAVGELYIGGVSVGRGYLGQPGLTAARFVANPDPSRPGDRVYRTGDLVRQRADGNLEFLSRVDAQIKIRGLRVEPAEIESAMCRHPQIAHAVVTVHERAADDRRLVGYMVPQARTRVSVADLRRFLGRELPPYLVPSVFVQLDAISLTTNGKVDHDRLPPPGDERPELVEELVLPQSPLEQQLATIVAGVLNVTLVGRNDNFFELGGDSILAIQVVARAQEQGITLAPLDLFEHPTVALLAQSAAGGGDERVVRPRPEDAEPVLSFDQERLWLEDRLIPGAAYNVGGRQRLRGPLDVAVLEKSIRAILVRHEALRSRFPAIDGHPVQVVDEVPDDWRLPLEDLSTMDGDREAAARVLMDGQATVGFDLENGPLFRCVLIHVGDDEHLLNITSHHIVADISSMGLLARELAALYAVGGDVERADLPPLPIQYRDFAVWQREWLVGDEMRRQLDYWRDHLAGAPPALTLPSALQHTIEGAGGDRARSALTEQETLALNEFCRKQGVTSFMVVLATLATVLGRWAGQPDVVVGVTISSRTAAGTENLIGCFVNTLPLRVNLAGDPTFAELLGRVREASLGGYANADAPLDVLVKELHGTRDPRRTPLFQVILNVVDVPAVERLGEVALEPVSVPPLPSSFDVVLTTQELHGKLQIQLEWNAERYQAPMMRILSEHLGTLMRAVINDASRGILEYPFQSGAAETAPAPTGAGRDWAVERFAIAAADRVTVLSTRPGHLASAEATASGAGATLVRPAEPFGGDVNALAAWLRAEGITVVYANPPLLRALAARIAEPLPALRYVFVENGGELIARDIEALRRLSTTCRYVCLYRTGADGRPLAAYEVPEDWQLRTAPLRVPLGTDLPDAPAQLRLTSGQKAAVGEVAEIWFDDENTGDLGRRWYDGTLEFVGPSSPASPRTGRPDQEGQG